MTTRQAADRALRATRHGPEARQHPEEIGTTVYDVGRDLRRDVAGVELPLDIDGADAAEAARRRLLDQLDEHLLPRLKELSSPAVVVIAGSTGAASRRCTTRCWARRSRRRASCARPPASRSSPTTRSTSTSSCTAHDRHVARRGARRRPRGTALLDARTSTRSSRRTGRRPRSSWRPRTCGSS
ncbi:hypothetical protein NKG05_01940 [Oerskovia sp. M15]